MQATLAELALLVDGIVVGDEELMICGAAALRDASPGEITLIDGNDRNSKQVDCRAAAAIVPTGFESDRLPTIQVDDIHLALAALIVHFHPRRKTSRIGISPAAVVSFTAKLAHDVDVHPLATIGDDVTIGAGSTIHPGVRIMAGSRIGRDVTIFPNAVLYEDTVVGPRSVIHAGAVLGAYGFGYAFVDNRHELSAQLGNVELGADVEIGAGTTVDRGTYGPTLIGEGTKIDDLVMVAHNCRIGRHNMLCSQVGVAGSTTTGDYVTMAGQVGVRDHVHIGTGAVLGAMAGVTNDVADGQRMIGIPATPQREQKLKQAALSKLPQMRREMKQLAKTVARLETELQTQATAQLSVQSDDSPDQRAVA